MTTFDTPEGIAIYRAITIKAGLKMYAKHKMQPNRMWTPTAMLAAASEITARTYKRGEYMIAHNDLAAWIEAKQESAK